MKNFALTGLAGYITPRHLKAIKDTGNRLVAAVDPHDSVGIIDSYFPTASFFTEIERFDRHLEKIKRDDKGEAVDYFSICSPNHLHDAHIRLAMRIGADAICEKPLVLNPWNLDALQELEEEYEQRVWTILQLRLHPSLIELERKITQKKENKRHKIRLTYITSRGLWYHHSWKGNIEKSGGIGTNIGVHFFDMLMWLFGTVQNSELYVREKNRMGGFLELTNADVEWFLSLEVEDIPKNEDGVYRTFREITVDNDSIEFSGGFTDLHTRVYEETLKGSGFGIDEARPSIELVHTLRSMELTQNPKGSIHPSIKIYVDMERKGGVKDVIIHESAYVDDPVIIGSGTNIWHFCHISKNVEIGKNCVFGQNVFVGNNVKIGNRVKVQNNVSIYTGCELENEVFLGPSCVLTNVSNPRSQINRQSLYEQTLFKRGCTVGANATIVCGITLGRYSFVGAGTVVTKDVPDYALIVGNPGKQKGWMSRHGHLLKDPDEQKIMVCPESGYRYKLEGDILNCLDLDEEESLPVALSKGEKPYDEFKKGV